AGVLSFLNPPYSVAEGNSGAASLQVALVQRTGGSSGAVSVMVRVNITTPGTATGGSGGVGDDYINTGLPVTISFADGDTTPKPVLIPIVGDTTVEPNETINLELLNPTGGATLAEPGSATVIIANDDSPGPGILQFAGATFSVDES